MPETPETPATEDTLGWRLLLEAQERFTEEDLQSIYQNIEDAAPRLEKYADAFAAAEKKYGLPAGLLHAVAAKESGGREDIISGKTASSAERVRSYDGRGRSPYRPSKVHRCGRTLF